MLRWCQPIKWLRQFERAPLNIPNAVATFLLHLAQPLDEKTNILWSALGDSHAEQPDQQSHGLPITAITLLANQLVGIVSVFYRLQQLKNPCPLDPIRQILAAAPPPKAAASRPRLRHYLHPTLYPNARCKQHGLAPPPTFSL